MKLSRIISLLLILAITAAALSFQSSCAQPKAATRIMTWNLLTEYWGGSPTSERCEDAASVINTLNADFIAVQEFSQSWRSDLMPLIPDYEIAGTDSSVTAVLYRADKYTLTECGFTPYYPPSHEQYETKRLTWAVFSDESGGEIIVASNHFSAGVSLKAERTRVIEARAAAATIDDLIDGHKDTPLFVSGDFNTLRILMAYPTFRRGSGLSDCRAMAAFGDLTPTYYDYRITIDYIFTRAGHCFNNKFDVVDTKTTRAVSDHLPIVVDTFLR